MTIALGVLTLGLALIHLTAGERQCARPMLRAGFDPVARWTMYVCWHAISAHLVLGGLGLIWAGATSADGSVLLVRIVSALHLVYAVLFLVIAFASRLERGWLRLGQWMAFLPIGALGLYATL